MTATLAERDLRALLETRDRGAIDTALRRRHPADVAGALTGLDPSELGRMLLTLPEERQAPVFGYLDPPTQVATAQAIDRRAMARILGAMSHDERADLFAALPEADRSALLPGLAQAERDDMRRLASYPEGSVGSVMTSDYATLEPGMTASEAIEHLRQIAPDAETIYHSYVVDAARRPVGTAALRDLIVARPGLDVEAIMRSDPPAVPVDAPREEAVRAIRRYDVLALPVVDGEGRLVGIVTYDDAMDVAEAESDRSFHRVGAVEGLPSSLRRASIRLLYRKRVFWLVLLVFANIFSGAGIAAFEDTIAAHVALVFFLPLLIDSGGNAGSQSATMMVRALATGDVRMSDWSGMLGRELAVAGALGLTMAAAVSVIGVLRGGPGIAGVVALTMVLIVVVGSLVGMSIPFALSRLGRDPATASAPLITSIADITGVLIYFGMATALLEVPPA